MTKFEKRVTAFLLAGLLCIPVTTVPSVSVNAEESDSTVQQEEEPELVVQNEETEVKQDGTEDQDTVDTEAEGGQEVSFNEDAGNNLSDGTLIPIEDGQGEDQKANKNEEKQTEGLQEKDEQNVAVAQRSARNNLSDEEIEEVTLGEDGEPVRMVTEIPESEESVRYLFQPEESGAYYIDLLGTGWFSVYKETADGYDEYIDGRYNANESAIFEFDSEATYYIDIGYDYWTMLKTINWKIGRPQDITPGTYETIISEANERAHYHLIYGESDIYHFEFEGVYDVRFYLECGDNKVQFTSASFQKVNKEKECYIDIVSEFNTGEEISWTVTGMDVQKAVEGEEIHSSFEEDGYLIYEFVPLESERYRIIGKPVAVYDESMNWIGNDFAAFEGGKTYYFVFEGYWMEEFDWYIDRVKELEIKENEIIQTEADESCYYKFIPEKNGIYYTSNSFTDIYDSDWDQIYGEIWQLSAGEVYYIVINSNSNVEWSIKYSTEISIQDEEVIQTDKGDSVHYKFIPTGIGRYYISGLDEESYDIYELGMDDSWTSVWRETFAGRTCYELAPGIPYYIVINNTEDVKWKINFIKEIELQLGDNIFTKAEESVYYKFIPEENGIYSAIDSDGNIIYDFNKVLTAGETYYIILNNAEDVSWSLEPTEKIKLEIDRNYCALVGQSNYYEFTPQVSGYYLLKSGSEGRCKIYDSNWQEIDTTTEGAKIIYDFNNNEEFGANIYMEAGQTYYIDIHPEADEAEWCLRQAEKSDEYYYLPQSDGTVQIIRYIGESTVVDVPEVIDGKVVGSIGYGAFSENYEISSVIIPRQLTELQQGSFKSCTNLQNVTLLEESKLQVIGNEVFRSCWSLENINLPDTIERIGDRAFSGCSNLSSINLGSTLMEIGSNTFSGCGLIAVDIPDSVKDLGYAAFNNCNSLQEVKLGNGVEGIPYGTFLYCDQLTAIDLPENIAYIGRFAFAETGLQKIVIPDMVTDIEEGAFRHCRSLQEVKFGKSVTTVGNEAFMWCDLREITFNDKLETIKRAAFVDNKNLESVAIPNTVTKIEYWAFEYCQNLRNIDIPDSVESIEHEAFDNTAWYDSQEDGVVYAGKVLYKYKGEAPEGTAITVDDGTKGIAENAFAFQYGIKEVNLPNTVTNIGEFAFYRCDLMTDIYIPGSVTEIGEYALGYFNNLEGTKVPDFTIYGVAGSAAQTYAEENGFTFVEVELEYTLGDVDASGAVDIADLRMVLRSVCGKATLTADQKLAADVEKDDVVNIQDLRKILRFVCRKIDSLA